jgi:drug/metabolite transporter (DMT)-like permease
MQRLYLLVLLALGLGWGVTQPLGKIATSTGHPPFGLIFWQLVVCVLVLGGLTVARGKGLPLTARALRFYVVVAVLGTLIPNYTFYLSVTRLPSGVMSVIIASIPMIAFPMALALGMDRFSLPRFAGLCLGLAGVAVIAMPGAALPDPAMAAWLPIAMIGPLFYAMEGTYVARTGIAGMDAVQAMLGASIAGVVMCLPMALFMGQWFPLPMPPGRAEWALIASSALHGVIYATYVWLAARAGSVFASQTSYVVTASGVFWAMALLGERLAPGIWIAVALMFAGMFLVRPKARPAQG